MIVVKWNYNFDHSKNTENFINVDDNHVTSEFLHWVTLQTTINKESDEDKIRCIENTIPTKCMPICLQSQNGVNVYWMFWKQWHYQRFF